MRSFLRLSLKDFLNNNDVEVIIENLEIIVKALNDNDIDIDDGVAIDVLRNGDALIFDSVAKALDWK